jgi:16S rRNA (guanine527-N7)-methyltransferase
VRFELPHQSIEALAGAVTQDQADALRTYGERILAASASLNLVSRASLPRLGEHFVDSAAVLSVVDVDGRRVVDLGSGGGFPGVVVAVLRPSAEMVLVESRRGKTAFLKGVQRELKLLNLSVVRGRVQDLGHQGPFELGLSRALGRIDETLAPSLRAVAPGGRLVLFKGPQWADEASLARGIAAAEGALLERVVRVELPGMGRATTFVVFHVKRGGS